MRNPEFYSAVFWIICDSEWKILFQKRQNTWYMDRWYQLPSGHLEGTETMEEWLIRELKEEIGISPTSLKISHITHRNAGDRVYFTIFAEIFTYDGEIQNLETEKCSELRFIDIENDDTSNIVPYNLEVLDWIKNGISLWEQTL